MEESISLIFNGDDPFSNISGVMVLSDEELLGMDPQSCSPNHLHNLLVDSPQPSAASAEIPFDEEENNELDLAMSFSRELYEREFGKGSSGSDPESHHKDQDRPSTSTASADSDSPFASSSMGASTSTDSGRESMGEEVYERRRKNSVEKMPEQSEEERKKSVLWKLMLDDEDQNSRPKSPEVIDLTEMSDALPVSSVQPMRPMQPQTIHQPHTLAQQQHPAQMNAPRMSVHTQHVPANIQFQQPSAVSQMQPPVIPRVTQTMPPPVTSQGLMAPPPYALSMNPHVNQKLNSYMAFGHRNVRFDPSVIPRVDVGKTRRKKKEKRVDTRTRGGRPYYVSSRAITDDDESHRRMTNLLPAQVHSYNSCTPIYKKLRMMGQNGPLHLSNTSAHSIPTSRPITIPSNHLALQSHASHQVHPYGQQAMQRQPMVGAAHSSHLPHQPPACLHQAIQQSSLNHFQPVAQWPRHGDKSAHSQPPPAKRPHPSPTSQQAVPLRPTTVQNPLNASPPQLHYSPSHSAMYAPQQQLPYAPNYAPCSGPATGPSYPNGEWPVTSHSVKTASQSPVVPDQANYYYRDPYAVKPTGTAAYPTPPSCQAITVSRPAQDQQVPPTSPVIQSQSAAGAEVVRQIEEELERVRKQAMESKQNSVVFVGSTDTTPSSSPVPQEHPVELQEAHEDVVVREVMRMIEAQKRPGYNSRGHYSPEHKAMMARKVSSGSSSSSTGGASTSALETRKRPISTDEQPVEGDVPAQGNLPQKDAAPDMDKGEEASSGNKLDAEVDNDERKDDVQL